MREKLLEMKKSLDEIEAKARELYKEDAVDSPLPQIMLAKQSVSRKLEQLDFLKAMVESMKILREFVKEDKYETVKGPGAGVP